MAALHEKSQQPRLRVAVIGAGLSGLVTIKECLAANLDVQAYDLRPSVGGAWVYQPWPDCTTASTDDFVWESSIYAGAMLNSCRDSTAYSDFPLDPEQYGDYFRHEKMAAYLAAYATRFGLNRHVRFRCRVLACEPLPDGKWTVRVRPLEGGQEEVLVFDAVFACSGHLSKPYLPKYAGRETFRGQFLHSHEYRTPGPFEGKTVAVVGLGSSAVDLACEIAPQAKAVHLITRRGGWVLPRYVLGKPCEAWDDRATQLWLPRSLSQWVQTKVLKLTDIAAHKELIPSHRILEQNPTIRGDFSEKVFTGLITPHRASVSNLTPTDIVLSNGATLPDVDVFISATGYHSLFLPYLPAGTVDPDTPQLYKLMIPPAWPNLFLIGFAEVLGPLPPLAEAQARHAVAMLVGKIPRPSREKMEAVVATARAQNAQDFVNSSRHALTVHSIAYIDDLLRPLGAVPAFGKLLRRAFMGNPMRALKVLTAVWFGLPASAQWRLMGDGANERVAMETVLRIGKGEGKLRKSERDWIGMWEKD